MRHQNRILKSKMPNNISEKEIREDQKAYKKAMEEFPKSVGKARPMYKYLISEMLEEGFIVVNDPPVLEIVKNPQQEERDARKMVLGREIQVILKEQIEHMLTYIVAQPKADRSFSVALSDLQKKKIELEGLI